MASSSDMRDPTRVGVKIRQATAEAIPQDLPLENDFREGTDYTITDHVRQLHARLTTPRNPRLAVLIDRLAYHLHTFAREVGLTHDEWLQAVELIGRTGKESTSGKDEAVLLSDCLGLSALVDELQHPRPDGCTESCEEGPFYTKEFPEYPSGSHLSHPDTVGQPLVFSASIKDLKGNGIPGAKVEVVSGHPSVTISKSTEDANPSQWQSDGDGIYDVMYPSPHPAGADDRGRIIAESDGSFWYRGVLPVAYPIPDDGPCGDILRALGRHPHRAAHLHFHITAPGFDKLTTALYPSHSPFLGTDPVFATRKSLVCELKQEKDPKEYSKWGWSHEDVLKRGGNVWFWQYHFVLATEQEVVEERERHKASRLDMAPAREAN